MHSPADRARAAVTECAFKPAGLDGRGCMAVEVQGMLDAGIVRACGYMTASMAPVYELLGVEAWEELRLTENGEMLTGRRRRRPPLRQLRRRAAAQAAAQRLRT